MNEPLSPMASKEKASLLRYAVALGVLPTFALMMVLTYGDKNLILMSAIALAGFLGLLGLYLVRMMKPALIAFAVLSLAVHLDVQLGYTEFPYSANFFGFSVGIGDIVFFMLFTWWMWEVHILKTARVDWHNRWVLIAFLMLMWNLLATALSTNPLASAFYFYAQFKVFLIFLYVYHHLKTERHFYFLIVLMLILLAFQGGMGVLQRFFESLTADETSKDAFGFTGSGIEYRLGEMTVSRVGGTVGHPNNYAIFINQIFFIAMALFLTMRNRFLQMALGGIMLVALVGELFSLSRSGWLGFLAAAPVVFTIWLKQRGLGWVRAGVLTLCIMVVSAGILLAASESLRNRLTKEDYGTAIIRIPLMEAAANMIADNPVIGVGPNTFAKWIGHYDRSNIPVSVIFPKPVHNTYLLIASESGIISLLLFLTLIYMILKRAWWLIWHDRGLAGVLGLGIFGSIVSYLPSNLTNYDYPHASYFFWLLVAIIAASKHIEKPKPSPA